MAYETITVTRNGSNVTVSPLDANVGGDGMPDQAKWVVQSTGGDAVSFQVTWKDKAAFDALGAGLGNGGEIIGSAIAEVKVKTEFEYGIEFRNADGDVVAHVDPKIIVWPRQ